jgi:uncharacterized membrane protein YraQ (UPF0718 family)
LLCHGAVPFTGCGLSLPILDLVWFWHDRYVREYDGRRAVSVAQPLPSAPASARRVVTVGATGVLITAAVLVLGLLWAKWTPYARKADLLSTSHAWSGGALFDMAGASGAAPTLPGAWRFATSYVIDVWKGFTVALVAAAAIDALVPRAWMQRLLNRRGPFAQALAGGTAALPSLMCTCCTAPLAVGLRRRGVGTAASLAYWVGNPVLNPAVLLFLFLVAPWQFGLVRLLVGAVLVFGASAVIARLLGPDDHGDAPASAVAVPADPARLREFPLRFARSLARLAIVLIPAYFLVMLAVGAVSGWLSDFSALDARLGVLAVLGCALIGTVLVIPTGGEIPVVLALSGAGAGAGAVAGTAMASAGALLITLPALSIPSMVMVGRALSWRVTVAMAAAVAAAGLLSGTLLWAALWAAS